MAHPYFGTPSGWPAHYTPSAVHMAHPYYVPGTPILYWPSVGVKVTNLCDVPLLLNVPLVSSPKSK